MTQFSRFLLDGRMFVDLKHLALRDFFDDDDDDDDDDDYPWLLSSPNTTG